MKKTLLRPALISVSICLSLGMYSNNLLAEQEEAKMVEAVAEQVAAEEGEGSLQQLKNDQISDVVKGAVQDHKEGLQEAVDTQRGDSSGKFMYISSTEKERTATDVPKSSGWLYLGQLTQGKWVNNSLDIGSELPKSGDFYPLRLSSYITKDKPSRQVSLKNVKILGVGEMVRILDVKSLSGNGHYWALISNKRL
jgi:hypothetical protein